MSTGWLITLGLILLYLALIVWLHRTGRMERYNLSLLLGFILMIRTTRGRRLIERMARPARLWNAFGDVGIVLSFIAMAGMTLLMIAVVPRLLRPDSGVEPFGASEILVIPGVNPFVPLWYGIAALIITLVVHEGGHGVLAIANKMRLKTLGLLVAVVPVGAFVEPDEDDMMASGRRKRLRVFAAGATVNIVLAGVLMFAFAALVGAAAPIAGAAIVGVEQDRPAYQAGMLPGDIIVWADDEAIDDWSALTAFLATRNPGEEIHLVARDGREIFVTLGDRWNDGLTPQERDAVMDGAPAGRAYCDAVVGPDRYEGGAQCAEILMQMPFLGVRPMPQPLADTTVQEALSEPFGNSGINFLLLVQLPIGEVRGAPYLSAYLPDFHTTPFHAPTFWALTTLIFWVFWINLMVGLTNVLPIALLDGGHLFRDGVGGLMARLRPRMAQERRDVVVGAMARVMTLVILAAFLLQIFGPRLAQAGWFGPY